MARRKPKEVTVPQTGPVEQFRAAFEKSRRDILAELDDIQEALAALGASSTGAPVDAQFIVAATNGTLTAERVLTGGTGITIDNTTPGQSIVNGAAAVTDEHIQDVVGAMVVAGHGIDVSYNDAGAIETIDVDETEFATGPGLISYAAIQNVTQTRVLGRTTGANGPMEELRPTSGVAISGTDLVADEASFALQAAQFVTLANTSTLANERRWADGHGIDSTDAGAGSTFTVAVDETELSIELIDRTIYEVDFSTLANNTFANGTEVIDGKNWTAFSVAAAGTFDIQNGTGMRWIPAVSTAGVFNNTNQTAAGIYIDLASLVGSSFRGNKRYSFEFYYSSRTLNTSSRVGPFLWNTVGTARVRGGGVNNSGGTHLSFAQGQATAVNGTDNVGAHNVFGIVAESAGPTTASFGTWSAGWPSPNEGAVVSTAATEGMIRGDTRLVVTHSHNSQNPVVDTVVLRAMRVVEL